MLKKQIRGALQQLHALNQVATRSAGPRYTPGMDPSAPNIAIEYLVDAFDALALVEGWRERVQNCAAAIDKESEYRALLLKRLFRRCRVTPSLVSSQVSDLALLHDPQLIRQGVHQLRRNCSLVVGKLQRENQKLWDRLQSLPEGTANDERGSLQSDTRVIGDLMRAVEDLIQYLTGAPGKLLSDRNTLLLLGSWGTGKTHLLCDIAKERIEAGAPALLILASSLPRGIDLLDGAAMSTGLATSGDELLSELNRVGEATQTRSLLMFDAINEGDREAWHQQLGPIAAKVSSLSHVGLVVSCRRPFNESLVTPAAKTHLVSIEHHGFEDQEFDAQLEFFSFYDLPAPSIPLITPEFTRPLFLKILCEALKDLSKRSQKRKLREVASGQKGMTYVLEYYTREIGRTIEDSLNLPRNSCWKVLKGVAINQGLAGRMAKNASDWLSADEAIATLAESLSLSRAKAEELLQRFATDGLLAEEIRWFESGSTAGFQFAYQRFGDHLIARHMLDSYLKPTTEGAIRRCFYANQPLGSLFRLDQWGRQFESPGLAAAVMLEFPERMKRSSLSHELLTFLPRARQLVDPIKEVFVEGLYWRSADAFTEDTDRIVNVFLSQPDPWIRNEMFEVLVGLATRPGHHYSADALERYLSQLPMAERDRTWSEFLRWSDPQDNAHRILAWVERSTEPEAVVVRNELRLLSTFLTTTNRPLRDRATRALVLRGDVCPGILFDEALHSLDFGDPYVPERMLAAAYGVAMRNWADPKGDALRRAIVPFARALVRAMLIDEAPYATRHALRRDYALGIIALARKVDPNAIALRQVQYLRRPFSQIPTPFIDAGTISDAEVEDARRAMHMDFANYTLGRLVPDRGNYQEDHVEYREVRRQIARRMIDLGYSSNDFDSADRTIARSQPSGRGADGGKVDRYGKKYSWIAFFEMYGLREDLGLLGEDRAGERTSDCDIDPSFPESPTKWLPPLSDVFGAAPSAKAEWLSAGPVPNYDHLLLLDEVDGLSGPWILLDGFIQEGGTNSRETFTFLRGVMMRPSDVQRVQGQVANSEYLGNGQIPEAASDYYTYAGEIPWSARYAGYSRLSSGHARRELSPMLHRFEGGRWRDSGRIEVPVHRWAWEGYHSSLNDVSGIEFPSAALCEGLQLVNHAASFDLWDATGKQASAYREFKVGDVYGNSHLLYLRLDLLKKYLALTNQEFVWVPWGERTLNHREFGGRQLAPDIQNALHGHENTHSRLIALESMVP